MQWLKIITQGTGWASMLAGIVTLVLKACGIEVQESAILPLITAALGLIHGGSFIPVVDKSVPVMPDMQNRTLDALFHLDKTLIGDGVQDAIAKLWAAARVVKPEGK